MESITKDQYDINNTLNKNKSFFHFLNRENALIVKRSLARRNPNNIGKLKKRFSTLHPEYIEDFIGSYNIGFGNSDYLNSYCIYTVTVI